MKSLYSKRILFIALMIGHSGFTVTGQKNQSKPLKSVFITGISYDSRTLEPLSNTTFKINNKNSFATNESGRFSFFGSPQDTIIFTYLGYQPSRLIVPDTLISEEYVMGVFMREQPIKLAEIIILPRTSPTSMIITPVQTDQNAMNIAQSNVDKAVVEGLTKAPKTYDAEMNAKKTMRTNQMRTEYKGMLVSPENSVGLSTQSYQTFNVIFGSPISTPNKVAKEMITNSENKILLNHFDVQKRRMRSRETVKDTINITPN